MAAQHLIQQGMSLNKALSICEVSKQKWYWKKSSTKATESKVDQFLLDMIGDIRKRRPFYGTRRVAAELSRLLGRPVNRKAIRRVYRLMGWNKPTPPKVNTKTRWKPIKAVRPNQLWQTDITYVWCGQVDGWCYCFNILSPGDGLRTASAPWLLRMWPWNRWWRV